MADDIVKRLRKPEIAYEWETHEVNARDAAAEIERLRGVQRAVVALARVVIASGNPITNKPWIDVIHMMDDEARHD